MRKGILIVALVGLLAGCSSGETDTSSPSPTSAPPSSTASSSAGQTASPPTAAQVSWAGTVCSDTSTLKTDVQGLATAAATGGDQVGTAVSDQMATIQTSAGALVDTVKSPPENLGDDPELIKVQDAVSTVNSSLAALQASAGKVQGTTGAALVDALATVVGDTGTVLSDIATMVQTITTATQDTASTLGQAFRAAPACATLTA